MPHHNHDDHQPEKKKSSLLGKIALAFSLAALGTSPYWYAVAKNGGFTDAEGATKTLEANNLTPGKVGGYSFAGCGSKADIIITKFEATNLKGEKVTGVVCKNVMGKSTYRVD